MPIYVYHPSTEKCCGHCEGSFEQLQKIGEPPLDSCPECGSPVAQTVTAPNIASPSPSMKEENLGKHGFTQYRKLEKGVYEKTVGKGPDFISDKNNS